MYSDVIAYIPLVKRQVLLCTIKLFYRFDVMENYIRRSIILDSSVDSVVLVSRFCSDAVSFSDVSVFCSLSM